ncbi:MAG: fluoride efflux transporter CrcB [Bacteroidales bacterium]|jgi:CrcB protein|nr:fluoride efflux transporter CrcB [Bacteroidales bacterium]
MIKTLLFVGSGGFLGSVARFLVSRAMQNWYPSAFPWGTFAVNVAGCLLIGLIYGFSEKSSLLTTGWKMFLAVGFCGGFTTFSTFANENIALLRDGELFYFFLYTALSVVLGLAATLGGMILTKIF